MKVILRKLTSKNQITLPSSFLEELQIKPVDLLEISKEKKAIKIRKAKGVKNLYGSFATKKKYSLEELKKIARKKFAQEK